MPHELESKLYDHIAFIYGAESADLITARITERLARFRAAYPELASSPPKHRVSERDSILITYGDMVQHEGQPPIQTLADFVKKYLGDVVSAIHILPFYPYSSDDGFSVIDYRAVNPAFGNWDDVARLGDNFRLMFDAVVNHISSQSVEFQGFLEGDPDFQEFFTVIEEGTDLSRVFRPRATPVVTPYQTADGEKLVWTTFNTDQIDLNYSNPDVLLEVIDILLFYAAQGADFIRLDAVTYIWKEIGTDCINLPRTHRIVQLMRTVLDMAAPRVAIITETNVPHKDNIAYFGDGTNQAQMVYNFALPMLTLHAFHKGDVSTLSAWAETLELPSDQATFFNFLASHDGIGMMPVKNFLSIEDLNEEVERTHKFGGFVSYKSNEDGSQSPYELNINYLDALTDPGTPQEDIEMVAKRFLASQAIMLSLRGVPGIYFHSLFGSRNWREGVEETDRHRTINRQKLQLDELEAALRDPNTLTARVFKGYAHLLKTRQDYPAFHPMGGQQILRIHKNILAILRTALDESETVLCLTNVTDQPQTLSIAPEKWNIPPITKCCDLLDEKACIEAGEILLAPYQTRWVQLV
ncbi:MAG: sugar phosphorylase [Anaerolineales bacterium]|nr:sugar phosphorylase [Anaerolineales bacterium]